MVGSIWQSVEHLPRERRENEATGKSEINPKECKGESSSGWWTILPRPSPPARPQAAVQGGLRSLTRPSLVVARGDLSGLFQPKQFCDSTAEGNSSPPCCIYWDEFTKQLRHFGNSWSADFLPLDRSFLAFFFFFSPSGQINVSWSHRYIPSLFGHLESISAACWIPSSCNIWTRAP